MKSLFLLLLSLLMLLSCDQDKNPPEVLSEDKMVEVLLDIHLNEGISSALPISYDSSQALYNLLEKELFANHGLSDSVFRESMRYYLQFPSRMDQLYERVIDSLVVKETLADSLVKM